MRQEDIKGRLRKRMEVKIIAKNLIGIYSTDKPLLLTKDETRALIKKLTESLFDLENFERSEVERCSAPIKKQ